MYLPNTLRLLRDYKKGVVNQIAVIAKHESGHMTNKKDSDFWKATQKLRDINQEIAYIEAL